MKSVFACGIAAMILYGFAGTASACGIDTNCTIGDRYYRMRMPEGNAAPAKPGVIVFAHGYKGNAAGIIQNKNLQNLADELGVVLIATKSKADDWALPGRPRNPNETGAAEFAYYEAVLDDLSKRHPVNLDRVMMSGFSAGGMMTWNLACSRSDLFAGFAPISGTFWAPVPASCEGPVANIVHIHGDADRIVPLEGRPIADTRQGSVTKALTMYTDYGDFGAPTRADKGDLRCEMRENTEGKVLDYCEFSGGHGFSMSYVRTAWERLEAAGQL